MKSMKNGMIYVGSTKNLEQRIHEHNNGENVSTKPYLPWRIEASIAVRTEKQARNLEKYFKTGSGKAILNKRILTDEALA